MRSAPLPSINGLPDFIGNDEVWEMSAEFRVPYVVTKYNVALRLQPKRICEIGVYSGIAALCFLAANPAAEYMGIDNLSAKHAPEMVPRTGELLTSLNYNAHIHTIDSQAMNNLPGEFDFIHVDGDHSRLATCHDVVLAWKALSSGGHILIDNGHDTGVCAGTFDAIRLLQRDLLNWEYLHEGVGSILIERPT